MPWDEILALKDMRVSSISCDNQGLDRDFLLQKESSFHFSVVRSRGYPPVCAQGA